MVKTSRAFGIDGPKSGLLLRALCELALLVIVGLVAARLFWLMVAGEHSVARPVAAPAFEGRGDPARMPLVQPNLALLTSRNAFASQNTAPVDDSALSVPETALNLKLQGIRAVTAGDTSLQSSATIVTPDNRQGVYVVGDKLLPDVVLARILSDRVILDKNGRFEALFLEGRDGSLRVLGGEEPRQEVGGRQIIEPAVFRVGPAARLMSIVRLVPAEGQGLRVIAASSPQALAEIGLNQDDVVISVDGRPVSELDYEQIIGRLTSTERVILSVRRQNETRQLTLVFEE